jgi:outer membrane protein OmpA-like peptidoglycan-associated protein
MAGAAGIVAFGTLLAGCSSVPDSMNPVRWYQGAEDALLGEDEAVADAGAGQAGQPPREPYVGPATVPGSDQPFPNLADVPARPRTSTAAERERLTQGLVADHTQRQYSNEVIPLQGSAEASAYRSAPVAPPPATRQRTALAPAPEPVPPPPPETAAAPPPAEAPAVAYSPPPPPAEAPAVAYSPPPPPEAPVVADSPPPPPPGSPAAAGARTATVPVSAEPPAAAERAPVHRKGAAAAFLAAVDAEAAASPPPPPAAPVAVPAPPPPAAPVAVAEPPPPPAAPTPAATVAPPPPALPPVAADPAAEARARIAALPTLDALPPPGARSPRGERPLQTVVVTSRGVDSGGVDSGGADVGGSGKGLPPRTAAPVVRPATEPYGLGSGGGATRIAAPVSPRQAAPAPQSSMPPSDAAAAGTERYYKVATILFGNASVALGNRERQILRQVAELYGERGSRIRVVGHGSEQIRSAGAGSDGGAGSQTSLARAGAVADELVRQGVPREAIVIGVATGDASRNPELLPGGDAGNRRAEVYFER